MNHFIVCLYLLTSCCCVAQQYDVNHIITMIGEDNFLIKQLSLQDDNISLDDTDITRASSRANFTISDFNGNLLAYSNGIWVDNAKGELMKNQYNFDFDIFHNSNTNEYDLRYSAFDSYKYKLVPFDEKFNNFLVFYTSFKFSDQIFVLVDNHIRYSRIDGSADNGLGAVVEKDVLLYEGGTNLSHVAISKHSNNKDYWMYFIDFSNHKFVSYLINEYGIVGPYFSEVGTDLFTEYINWHRGKIISNKEGNMIAVYYFDKLHLYEFDPCYGELGKRLDIYTHNERIWYASFTGSNTIKFVDRDQVLTAIVDDGINVTHISSNKSIYNYENLIRWRDNDYITFVGRDLIILKDADVPNAMQEEVVVKDFLPGPIFSAYQMACDYRPLDVQCSSEIMVDESMLLPKEQFTFDGKVYTKALRSWR